MSIFDCVWSSEVVALGQYSLFDCWSIYFFPLDFQLRLSMIFLFFIESYFSDKWFDMNIVFYIWIDLGAYVYFEIWVYIFYPVGKLL